MVQSQATGAAALIERIDVAAYKIPTDAPESDGTLEWDSTTMVVVHVHAGGQRGFGYTYAGAGAASVVQEILIKHLKERDAMDIPGCYQAMFAAVRNNGQTGLTAMAVAAVDNALWDLKAKVLRVPLVSLLGAVHERLPVYGSGGFTSYDVGRLGEQMAGYAAEGMQAVKMKIARDPEADPRRIDVARQAVGDDVDLFVDANEALDRKRALAMAEWMAPRGVTWFEQPICHRDLDGMRMLRDRLPATIEISTGEYGFVPADFRQILQEGAVDVLQADATRCGITGFLRAGTLAEAWGVPFSSHCAPALHVAACCSLQATRHMEWFHDHVRIERMLLDGAPRPTDGWLAPDRSRLGLGYEFKEADARQFAV